MAKIKAATVAEYIAKAPKASQKHLRALRAILRGVAPKAQESIKWNTPVYEEKRILFAFAAFRAHINFMPTPAVIAQFKDDLADYKTGKGSIQLPYDRPLPKTLLKKIAARRVKELREKDARWM
jgi:uncharacterized protein YdhG (YjbR/CyaY superfamily)